MEEENWNDLLTSFDYLWNGNISEGHEFVAEREDRDPGFKLLLCEEDVITAFLAEQPEQFQSGSKNLDKTIKHCEETYKATKKDLKTLVSLIGKAKKKSSKGKNNENVEEGSDPVIADIISSNTFDVKNIMRAVWCKVVMADCLLFSSALKFKLEKWVPGLFNFRKSWKTYEEINEVMNKLRGSGTTNENLPLFDQVQSSIDFGMAIFLFAVSSVPNSFKWIVEGVGFKGDRQRALNLFDRCVNTPKSFRGGLAHYSLAWIYGFFYQDFEKCNEVLEIQVEKYPNASVVYYTVGYIRRREGRLEESSVAFEKAKDTASDMPQFAVKMGYELGYNLYLKLQWEEATVMLEEFLENINEETKGFRAYCSFQIAFCALNLGDEEKCSTYLKKGISWSRKNYAFDEFTKRWGNKYFKKPVGFTEFEKVYLKAFILHEACDYDACLELLDSEVEQEIKFVDDKASYFYLKGSCLNAKEQLDEAKQLFQDSIEFQKRIYTETYVTPWSYNGIAEIAIKEGNVSEAQAAVKKAKSFSGYDFENILTWRIRKVDDEIIKLQ